MEKSFIRFILIAALAVTAACGASPSSSRTAGSDGSTGTAATSVVIVVSPLAAQVTPGGSIALAASVTGTADTGVAWSVQEGAAGGSVNSAGLYQAPATEGTFHVVATSHADPSKIQIATVSVTAAGAGTGAVVLSPAFPSADACQTVAFSATLPGTTNSSVTWSVKEGPSGGTITPDGVYTAPPAAGTYHVVATSMADPTRSAEAAVNVGPEKVLSLAVTPGSASVTPGGAIALAAIVTTSCGSFAAQ